MILIKNGTIKTMAGQTIVDGQLLLDGGKIAAVGQSVEAPAHAQIIDAAGCLVTPGLVEGHCHIGLEEEAIGFEGSDGNEKSDPITPQMRGIDAVNPMCEAFDEARRGGVTTAITGPGSANVIGGTFLAIKLFGKRVDDMVLRDPVAMKCAFGENPKRVYNGMNRAPRTRMATAFLLRETLAKAKRYMEEQQAAAADGTGKTKPPALDMRLEAMIPVLRREIPLKAHAHRADDIFTALRIAKEFDVEITLDHCTDGALIADELARENRPVLVGSSWGSKSKYELKNKGFETPGVLANAGLEVAIITDAPVTPLKHLALFAGLAVKSGMDEEAAWRAITINPAKMYKLDSRIGSIEVGKDADIAIFRGNPMRELDCETLYTIIDGEIRYCGE